MSKDECSGGERSGGDRSRGERSGGDGSRGERSGVTRSRGERSRAGQPRVTLFYAQSTSRAIIIRDSHGSERFGFLPFLPSPSPCTSPSRTSPSYPPPVPPPFSTAVPTSAKSRSYNCKVKVLLSGTLHMDLGLVWL